MEHDRLRTRAWVLHPDIKSDRNRRPAGPALSEGVALAAALPDLDVIGSEVVPLPKPHAGTLFGSGKIAEIAARLAGEFADARPPVYNQCGKRCTK